MRIAEIGSYVGQRVQLQGWLSRVRSSGKIQFLQLRDGTGWCQCIFLKSECEAQVFDTLRNLGQESSLQVEGVVREEPRSPGGFELGAQSLKVLQSCHNFPITPKEHGPDFLLNHRHLWLRSKKQHALLRLRHHLIRAIRNFFDGRGFTLVDTPVLTPAACEGTSTLFETKYFDTAAYLSQSGQLYNEASAAALGKVYCFGPTFRAERSKTRKHLLEFWMVEPEVAFCNLADNMQLAEDFVVDIVQQVQKHGQAELKVLEQDLARLERVQAPFKRLHYNEACAIIKKHRPEFVEGGDFGAPDEEALMQEFEAPVFVHRFPSKVKAFYMREDPNEEGSSLSCDLIAPDGGGEIIGGGERETDVDILLKKIDAHGLKREDFQWYLDLRRYGSFQHAGFGLGVERTLRWLSGVAHIRESIAYPRLYGRLHP